MKISENLQAALESSGMKRSQLAIKAKVTEASISRYLADKAEPRSAELLRMAIALNVSTDWLLGRSSHLADRSGMIKASPAQRALATNAAHRILMATTAEDAMNLPQMKTVILPREEAECLAAFAAENLDMKPEDFDLGEWVGPAPKEGGRR